MLSAGDEMKGRAVTDISSSLQLDGLSLEELKYVEKKARELIKTRTDQMREVALQELERRASELGFDLRELVESARDNRGNGNGKASKSDGTMYVHPDDPDLVWSGRGRHPLWLKELLIEGVDPSSLIVNVQE